MTEKTKLELHFEKMQDMMVRYIEPTGLYTNREGVSVREIHSAEAFISDMIYMLDGPEQREAQSK
jgi:hypothetical protein